MAHAQLPDSTDRPGLLVLDAAYTLEMIRERGLEASITCRDLDGYFGHVFSVHPFATLLTSPQWGARYGAPQWYRLNDRNTVIEGRIGRFGWLAWLFPANFLIGQIGLLARNTACLPPNAAPIRRCSRGWGSNRGATCCASDGSARSNSPTMRCGCWAASPRWGTM